MKIIGLILYIIILSTISKIFMAIFILAPFAIGKLLDKKLDFNNYMRNFIKEENYYRLIILDFLSLAATILISYFIFTNIYDKYKLPLTIFIVVLLFIKFIVAQTLKKKKVLEKFFK
ncbi:hypothetical protein [Miniphocaeibacter halophilus]|uniref:Uncharacterized protein n=1 Tax=Miniphocaeibacter halophilus TaxID=2931922 RepID=A0AC61MTF8_9FIRM|nr:hypothetical protein [Miniphocaeibacter halophilus]QQK08990.1 hypothetical protein JFY71_05485 [Miniphocaeibacter halophilus]